jgi:hypothetical protein
MNGAFLIVEAGTILTHGGMRIQKNENNKKSLTFNGVNQYFDIDYIGGQFKSSTKTVHSLVRVLTLKYILSFL